ncbi:unnamed protein product [Discula destructiva]
MITLLLITNGVLSQSGNYGRRNGVGPVVAHGDAKVSRRRTRWLTVTLTLKNETYDAEFVYTDASCLPGNVDLDSWATIPSNGRNITSLSHAEGSVFYGGV